MSFLSAVLYSSSLLMCSLEVSRGDLVAIRHTPSYHSGGHKPEMKKFNKKSKEFFSLM